MEKSELEKVYKVFVNSEEKEMSYEDVCKELGFIPEIGFVDITDTGAITFTVGKSEEIKELYSACQSRGFKISKRLTDVRRSLRLF
nr:MAG TPA: amylase [Caudoviricetes sp.]